MRQVCVNVSVRPGTLAQQVAWAKLWQRLLAPEATENPTLTELTTVGSNDERERRSDGIL